MRLIVAVGLLLAALAIAVLARSAAVYYLASGAFVLALFVPRRRHRRQ